MTQNFRKQCVGFTQTKRQCLKNALYGKDYCNLHSAETDLNNRPLQTSFKKEPPKSTFTFFTTSFNSNNNISSTSNNIYSNPIFTGAAFAKPISFNIPSISVNNYEEQRQQYEELYNKQHGYSSTSSQSNPLDYSPTSSQSNPLDYSPNSIEYDYSSEDSEDDYFPSIYVESSKYKNQMFTSVTLNDRFNELTEIEKDKLMEAIRSLGFISSSNQKIKEDKLTKEMVLKQYKKGSLIYHPDKGGDEEMFKALVINKDVLVEFVSD
jgi:curved DNA-binding protein CbpA